MTGIVLWKNNHNNSPLKTDSEYVQLEYEYLDPSKTVVGESFYDSSSSMIRRHLRPRLKPFEAQASRWCFALLMFFRARQPIRSVIPLNLG